jgi:hypothetical protein
MRAARSFSDDCWAARSLKDLMPGKQCIASHIRARKSVVCYCGVRLLFVYEHYNYTSASC